MASSGKLHFYVFGSDTTRDLVKGVVGARLITIHSVYIPLQNWNSLSLPELPDFEIHKDFNYFDSFFF